MRFGILLTCGFAVSLDPAPGQGPLVRDRAGEFVRVVDRFHAQRDVVPEEMILDGRMIPIAATTAKKGSGIWKDPIGRSHSASGNQR